MFPSLVLSMAAATKKRKEKKKLTLGRLALVAGTITNIKQSILETFDIYVLDAFWILDIPRVQQKNY